MVTLNHDFKASLAAFFLMLQISSSFTTTSVKTLSLFSRPSTTTKVCSTLSMSNSASNNNIVVISPPGGVGEVTAVESAKRGASVWWFVISPSSDKMAVSFSEDSLEIINAAGGNVDLAGSEADNLLLSPDDPNSSLSAVSSWCGRTDAIISSMDIQKDLQYEDRVTLENAIKVAVKEACDKCLKNGGMKVAVTSLQDLDKELEDEENGGENANPVTQVFSSLLDGKKVKVPSTLKEAMGSNTIRLRHGELFGLPESTQDASPFVGGPRRDPILREEYTNRAIRLDSSVEIYANPTLQSKTKSSRLSMGEAAALLALNILPTLTKSSDLCLASLRGSERLSEVEWINEFTRIQSYLAEGKSLANGSELFSAGFGSVPNKERFADWLATKWAPAILRTYEIAGIRVGARPVYASRMEGNFNVEIVWQELVNFETKVVGKLEIEILEDGTGMVARRMPGNPAQGYGKVSLKPLAGEDVIIRSLADAAAQAIEKGLAIKPSAVKSKKPMKKAFASAVPVTSTVASSGNVAEAPIASPSSLESGPRSAGARRSSERARGKRRKKVNAEAPTDDSSPGSWQ